MEIPIFKYRITITICDMSKLEQQNDSELLHTLAEGGLPDPEEPGKPTDEQDTPDEQPTNEEETPAIEEETPVNEEETPTNEEEAPTDEVEVVAVAEEVPEAEVETSAAETEIPATEEETPDNGTAYPIATPTYTVAQPFNVAKKVDNGEDADPLVLTTADGSWGLVAVFDGMGGAGGRKVVDPETGETHTHAYWASRFVRECVETYMAQRPQDKTPEAHLDEGLHQAITDFLEAKYTGPFVSASTVRSTLIRILPTTMALCLFEVGDGQTTVHTYWAGDSRVYALDGQRLYFLTKDDANTDDPFAPANMDMTMNNTIGQDRPFRINKCTTVFATDTEHPLALLASTDGCFGYFYNPIEFDRTLRQSLAEASDWNDWSRRVDKAVKDNIQQDDYSMAIATVRPGSFENAQARLTAPLTGNQLFADYAEWRGGVKARLEALASDRRHLQDYLAFEQASRASRQADDAVAQLAQELDALRQDYAQLAASAKERYAIELPPTDEVQTISQKQEQLARLETEKAEKDTALEAAPRPGGDLPQLGLDEAQQLLEQKSDAYDQLRLQVEQENNDDWYARYARTSAETRIENLTIL